MRQAVDRAKTAYYRQAVKRGERHPPLVTTAGVVAYQGQTYVVLHGSPRVLAVYLVLPTGVLCRVRRWPQALEDAGVMPS